MAKFLEIVLSLKVSLAYVSLHLTPPKPLPKHFDGSWIFVKQINQCRMCLQVTTNFC